MITQRARRLGVSAPVDDWNDSWLNILKEWYLKEGSEEVWQLLMMSRTLVVWLRQNTCRFLSIENPKTLPCFDKKKKLKGVYFLQLDLHMERIVRKFKVEKYVALW